MESYKPKLKKHARQLRIDMTEAEQMLWYRLRRKQIHGVQFNRQKPLFNFIADFYCAKAKLVIELDGGQHFEPEHLDKDIKRDNIFESKGLRVLRFDNNQVLTELDNVVGVVWAVVGERLGD